MTCYFRLDTAVDDAAAGAKSAVADRMVRAFADEDGAKASHADKPDAGEGGDSGVLVSKAGYQLLDLDAADAVQRLSDLMGKHEAFRFAAELVLDEAFDLADSGAGEGAAALKTALQAALGDHGWPKRAGISDAAEALLVNAGELNFPFIDHLDTDELARLYVDFLHHLPDKAVQREYGLDVVVRLNRGLFYKYYDGFISGGVSHIRFDRLVSQAARVDHDPLIPMEEYTQRGREKAEQSGCRTAAEHLAAFVAADGFQLARCKEIHTVLSLGGELPEWIRADIFRVLEHEAMKQYHAECVVDDPEGLVLVAGMPMLRKALQTNAGGEVSEMLQRLLRETLSPSGYAGAAGEFTLRAGARAAEWRLNAPQNGG